MITIKTPTNIHVDLSKISGSEYCTIIGPCTVWFAHQPLIGVSLREKVGMSLCDLATYTKNNPSMLFLRWLFA